MNCKLSTFCQWAMLSQYLLHTSSFLINSPALKKKTHFKHQFKLHSAPKSNEEPSAQNSNNLDIVLFGIGDLRTSDHGGLHSALQQQNSKILPLLILDTDDTLKNIPGAKCHTIDTVEMLSGAITSLEERLKRDFGLDLYIKTGKSVLQCLNSVLKEASEGDKSSSYESINVHVCDLGHADVSMNYHPYSFLRHNGAALEESNVSILPWTCNLRDHAWNEATSNLNFPTNFPDYSTNYIQDKDAQCPLPYKQQLNIKTRMASLSSSTPSHIHASPNTLLSLLTTSLGFIETHHVQDLPNERYTGLYLTHWGGLDGGICGEEESLQCLKAYAECNENDELFLQSSFWKQCCSEYLYRNPASLEHASLSWMSSNATSAKNLLRGEFFMRYMAAPLFLGCVSPRQLWHAYQPESSGSGWFSSSSDVMKQIAEAREWHKLYAAFNIQHDTQYNTNTEHQAKNGQLQYKYNRYHGFLYRYALSPMAETTPQQKDDKSSSTNIILVHGFGASSAQWSRTISSLSSRSSFSFERAMAPDLLGFGQSEKPSLTYTQYLWEGQVRSFLKEHCSSPRDENVLAGNSIGGYTSMATIADDTVLDTTVPTATGAPGTGTCKGLVLMNTAGKLYTPDEANDMTTKANSSGQKLGSVADATIGDTLGPCSPPPNFVASTFGKVLLWYLRPRIQSICVNLYPSNPSAVDSALCDNILRDSLDPGALYVMISGSKLPPPRTANELLDADHGCFGQKDSKWTGPVLIAQGMKDPLNDAAGRARLFSGLRDGIVLNALDEAGHCPHDEVPEDMAKAVCKWWDEVVLEGKQQQSKEEMAVSSASS